MPESWAGRTLEKKGVASDFYLHNSKFSVDLYFDVRPQFAQNRLTPAPFVCMMGTCYETFSEHSILLKYKEGDNFNHRNTLSISRIEI
jgi:hypothetical protein